MTPSARDDGSLDCLEDDVMEGGQQCLEFLMDGLTSARASPTSSIAALEPPYVEDQLGDKLRRMLDDFKAAGCEWEWQIDDVCDVQLERMFCIIGGKRSSHVRRGTQNILAAFGQQFVLTKEQAETFLHKSNLQGRVQVMQDLLFSDLLLVADVAVVVKQRQKLVCPGQPRPAEEKSDDAPSSASGAGDDASRRADDKDEQEVTHVLRLEMAFKQENTYHESGVPSMRPESWQVVDWNWICKGNHPNLPTEFSAPW
eukprot:TRINITY_DN24433_c0_g1_i3.p1 TRINITY_DN24433_c0_g1~~TRINITY_DN24433_c0_g1_i3.p1  ORF type:complete len:256 (+),score=41.69 TRINITY_DN24433_c0_g1_i3:157-924(+)